VLALVLLLARVALNQQAVVPMVSEVQYAHFVQSFSLSHWFAHTSNAHACFASSVSS